MPITLKQVLSGVMIAGDALLMLFFGADLLSSTYEPGMDIFMLCFLAVDAYLSIDYIVSLYRQKVALDHQDVEEHVASIREQAREEKLEQQRESIDDALAEDVRNAKVAEPDPEELKEMLAKDYLTSSDTEEKQN